MKSRQLVYENEYRLKKVRVWGKGQLTIPADIREKMGIDKNTILDVYQIGGALVITPEKLLVTELATAFSSATAAKELDLANLLTELRENSHDYEAD